MSWNYRVIEKKDGTGTTFAIHEVYYDEEGSPYLCTINAVAPMGETLEDLRADVKFYNTALEKPVLDYETIVGRE